MFQSSDGGLTWSAAQKLVSSDGAAGDQFGWYVSVSGDKLVVGARGDANYNGTSAGDAAY